MTQTIDLQHARQRRATRFIDSSRELRGEMRQLCSDLEEAVGRLEEAREAVDRARTRIEICRSRMERLRRLTPIVPPRGRAARLRLIPAG